MNKAFIHPLADTIIGSSAATTSLVQENKAQISFSIRLADRMYFVLVDNIAFIYLEGETVYLIDVNGEKHVMSKTLESIEKAIPAQEFYRINRQMIVNRHAIKDVAAYANQRIVVHLTVPIPEAAGILTSITKILRR